MYVYNKQPVAAEKLQQMQPSLKSMRSWNASFAETLGGDKGQEFFNMIAVFVRRFYVVASVQVSFGFFFFTVPLLMYSAECLCSKPFGSTVNPAV